MAERKNSKGLIKDAAGRSMTPENLDELVATAIAMEFKDAKEAGALGFQAHCLTLTTLPHSRLVGADGQELREYHRVNGRQHLAVQAGPQAMPGTGIAYGTIPRLATIYMASQAKKTNSPVIDLGGSMAEFLRRLDIATSGGKRGGYRATYTQLMRWFTSSVMTWDDTNGMDWDSFKLVEKGSIWWNPLDPEAESLWRNTLTLSARAYDEMTQRAVPVDLRGLRDGTIHRSPLALDFYVWLPYRSFTATATGRKASIPWPLVMKQFGAGYAQTARGLRDFRAEARKSIQVVLNYYRHLRVDASGPDFLVIEPSWKALAENPVD